MSDHTYIGHSPGKGRGVFAAAHFEKGDVIEIAQAIVVPAVETRRWAESDVLSHYTYDWGRGRCAIAGGTALFYNHADDPNVDFIINPKSVTITFVATRDINQNEELFICYSDEPMLLPEKRAKKARGQ